MTPAAASTRAARVRVLCLFCRCPFIVPSLQNKTFQSNASPKVGL